MNNNHAKASAKTVSENDPIILEMLNSDCWWHRCALVKLGFHLDKLKDDKLWFVRHEVVHQGAYLHELKNDPDGFVRRAALEKLKKLKEKKTGDTDEQ